MPKKLSAGEVEKIVAPLSAKDRRELIDHLPDTAELEERIQEKKKLMKRDAIVGPVWVILYGVAWFKTGVSIWTGLVFLAGASYFVYSIFTTGSYGINQRRLKVYQKLLDAMQ